MKECPKDRTETRTITWRAVVRPVLCQCGHDHWGWSDGSALAPQWGYCETCGEHGLYRVGGPVTMPTRSVAAVSGVAGNPEGSTE